eukprot:TRINITY_DN4265_c0_g1_i1.p1 TRINITY_DN4265_c0_g1~~TRINITY_DN4265_c0_g1_i1.p1  ORF type:complete len:342 (+),score=93.83 TRINITY_DN4265_c0_g1_i1:51-1076(+)
MGNVAASTGPAQNRVEIQNSMNADVERVRTVYEQDVRTSREEDAVLEYHDNLQYSSPLREYVKVHKIGEGSSGVVYKVTKKSNGATFAMKCINTSAAQCTDDMLHREIGTMLQCDHPYLIGIEDLYLDSQVLYIIMELVEQEDSTVSPDLFSWVTEGYGIGNRDITEKEAACIAYRIASAIKYMNERMEAIHRDLKLENVLVGPGGIAELKVTDYGLARLGASSDGMKFTFSAGTEGYMAPEVMDGSKVETDGRISYGDEPYKVDVFSLGVIMFICFTKTPPFRVGPYCKEHVRAENYNQTKMRTIPAGAQVLIKGMLEVDQKKRLSIDDVLANEWLNAHL